MAPHAMETILQAPQWPASLSHFVTWCLMWDPKNRPTSFEVMNHEYFADAVDPLRPKVLSRLGARKHSGYDGRPKDSEPAQLSSRSSWFRKSLIGRDSAAVAPQQANSLLMSPRPSPVHHHSNPQVVAPAKGRPNAGKRATWSNGPTPSLGAPMPVLPSIRPVSPLSSSVTAQAQNAPHSENEEKKMLPDIPTPEKKKLGRQLYLASHRNHYSDFPPGAISRLTSPTNGQKESFFAHLRKRARRLSGRNQVPTSPKYEDIEANVGFAPLASNRSSMMAERAIPEVSAQAHYAQLDKALQRLEHPEARHVGQYSNAVQQANNAVHRQNSFHAPVVAPKRTSSVTQSTVPRVNEELQLPGPGPVSSRTRRALHLSSHPSYKYETPDEEDELLDEALHGVQRAVKRLDKPTGNVMDVNRALNPKDTNRQSLTHSLSVGSLTNPYPTPSPSAKRNGVLFNNMLMDQPTTPINIVRNRAKENNGVMWPTPPYEENEWAASAAASIFAAGSAYT